MQSVTRGYPGHIFEPIVTASGGLLGFELARKLQRSESQQNSVGYECLLSPEDKIKVFFNQVTLACVNANIFTDNDFLLSINIDYDIACHIVSNTAMRNVLQQHRFIRLEVDQNFPEFTAETPRQIIRSLSEFCTLWLDNFGAGNTSLSLVMNESFEYIKINDSFFWQHQGTQSFRKIIEHLTPYCQGVIVKGVENAQHVEYLNGSNILAMQGVLWASYNQEELIQSFFLNN
ncbi:EAL domain-containing protein [Rahnella sikkimica]|uniref:Diguanylate phosphodiesterase n=1 Tax=Rahnella sikkimica TaxID=1805933 RepID=A0A2L1US49_9GAMM|nr:EAL domain-containing protein [Rahnella sikkimica]AVF35765.1 diguanylate phosphodiesterase [Rahnella sikkimica]